jgi:acyl-CoA synthetase (AMP-forming)/AMP-acid ligase II/NAD(P)-dependent dehydrogenase (short-subunit alcohol dehydrogenase family)
MPSPDPEADVQRHIEAERAIRAIDGIDDVVVLRVARADAAPMSIAYVVPRCGSPLAAGVVSHAVADLRDGPPMPIACVELRAVPLTRDGEVDMAALLAVEVIDAELMAKWEDAFRRMPGVRDVAVVVEPAAGGGGVVHLSDLLPGWARRGDAAALVTAPSSADTSASEARRRPALADGGPLEIPADAPRTLAEALVRTAAERGTRGIRIQSDDSEVVLTYAELLDRARRMLTGLRRAGLGPGDRAILQLSDLEQHLPAFWACILGGIKPVTVAVPIAYDSKNSVARKLVNTWRLLERPAILTTDALRDRLAESADAIGLHGFQPIVVARLLAHEPAADLHPSVPDDVAFFQLSSGSTGMSKCIQIRHGGVVAHIHGSRQHLGLGPEDVTLNWLPMDHVVPLLMYHVKDVYLGIEQIQVAGAAILGDPLRWLDLIDRHRVTHTWSPNFGFKMLADALAHAAGRRWDLSCVKGFLNAGEQVTEPVVRDFLARVAPFGAGASTMQPAFGMAEVCTAMTYDNHFDLDGSVHRFAKASLGGVLRRPAPGEPSVAFVDCGPVVRGVQIRIADRGNTVLSEGVIGRLQIKGPVVTPGYLNNPAANAEAMLPDGWFNTGDLGFIWNGRLTITGREKELIIVNGANFYCYEIEDIAAEVPGVLPTFAAACGIDDAATGTEALAVFFVHDESIGAGLLDVVASLRRAIASQAGLSPAYVVPLPRDEFPKTTSGKIQRGQLKRALLEGEFDATLKALDLAVGNANTIPDWFHRTVWRPRQPTPPAAPVDGVRLLLTDRHGLGAQMAASWRSAGHRSVLVEAAAGFRKVDVDHYEVDAADAAGFERIVDDVTRGAARVALVAHLWAYGEAEDAAASGLEELFRMGGYGLPPLVRALGRVQGAHPVRVLAISTHACGAAAGDDVLAGRAALTGLARTLRLEMPWIDCRHVDVSPGPPTSHLADALREADEGSTDVQVAYRGGVRLVSRLAQLDLSAAPAAPPPFVRGGAYLLTGGLGGVGRELAKHLLERYEARLLIVGRTSLGSDRDPAADSDEAARVSALAELRQLSGSVRYACVDVADEAALRDAVERAAAEWQRGLDGVFHLAGVFHERMLADETPEGLASALRSKAGGAAVLHRLVEDRPNALFVTFSSAYGCCGGFAAGAYAAANAFLDGFVHWQRRRSGLRSVSVAWTMWDGIGMSRGYGAQAAAARGFRLISAEQGLNSLLAVLHRDVPHAVVGVDPDARAVQHMFETDRPGAQRLVAYVAGPSGSADASPGTVLDRVGRQSRCAWRAIDRVPRTARGAVDRRALANAARGVTAEQVEPRTDLEEVVMAAWREALKQSGLSVHDNFFELGGTSFLAGQIAGRLRTTLGTAIVSTQMFQYPTIAAQAAFLAGDGGASVAMVDSQTQGAARREAVKRLRRGPRARG